jgi:aminopeptidase N
MGDLDFYRAVRCECSKCNGIIVCGERNLLPTAVRPTNYKLKLQPDLSKHTYGGCVEIALECREDCSTITLHSNEIDIKKALLSLDGGEPAECAVVGYDKDEQTATLFAAAQKGQKGVLTLHFTGVLNDVLAGFYRTAYTSKSGEQRFGAVTQFEATDARRAFPCFDEPLLKATFDVTLRVAEDRVALSNMPVASEGPVT